MTVGFYERGHGDKAETLRVTGTETGASGTTWLLLRTVPDPGWQSSPPIVKSAEQLEEEGWRWVETPTQASSVARDGYSQCVRCRRVNFGPCISETCTDLQAAYVGTGHLPRVGLP